MSASDDRRDLLQATLGLFDHLPLGRVRRLRDRGITTYATTFPASSVYELLDAVEKVSPGLLDGYIALRQEEQSQQQEEG